MCVISLYLHHREVKCKATGGNELAQILMSRNLIENVCKTVCSRSRYHGEWERTRSSILKYDITDCFNKNKIQTAVTNMMKQRMLQKTKILKTWRSVCNNLHLQRWRLKKVTVKFQTSRKRLEANKQVKKITIMTTNDDDRLKSAGN